MVRLLKTQKKYDDINAFNNSAIIYNRKQQIFIISWISIFIISFIFFTIIVIFYKYTIFNIYYGKVVNTKEENSLYIAVDSDFVEMKNRNYLNISGEDYKCKLKKFNDKYYYIGTKKYWDVIYNCEIPSEINVNDNLIEVKVIKRKTTIFKEILAKIKKGVKNARVKN